MIDGIKIWVKLFDFSKWKKKTGISFTVATDIDTGAVKGRKQRGNPNNITFTHSGHFEHYSLKVLETHYCKNGIIANTNYNLIIEGSFHKNYFSGKNYKRFTFDSLQIEIKHLCAGLYLIPAKCKIQNIEIGVNIHTSFEVISYIHNSVLLHSVKPFEKYNADENGMIIGRVATHTQHSAKCYDKGLQHGLDYPLMRFEVRVIKMQYLKKYKIKTLADLADFEKVNSLQVVVLTAWENVLIYENDIEPKKLKLTNKQSALLVEGRNRDYWERLKKIRPKFFNKERVKFRELMAKYSTQNTYTLIRELIKKEWVEMQKMGTILPSVKQLAKITNGNDFTVKVNSKNVPIEI